MPKTNNADNKDETLAELKCIREALEAIAIIMMQNQSAEASAKQIPKNLPFLGQAIS